MSKPVCLLVAMSLFALGCVEPGTIETPPEEFDLVEPLENPVTGYYSTLALEMEGIFSGKVLLDLSDRSDPEQQEYVESLRSDRRLALQMVDTQIKFSKNQLNTEKLHINISSNNLESYEVAREGNVARISYSLRTETLIMNDDLEEAGIDPDSFTTKEYQVLLPADHRNLVARIGESCAEGHDQGDLEDHQYFYYFKPDKPGCNLDMVQATFRLNSLLPQKNTYPEYHRLVADRKIMVAVFFGRSGHEDPLPPDDLGIREHDQFVRDMRNRGFSFVQNLEPKGVRYQRTRAELTEILDIVSPQDLDSLHNDTDGLFKQAMLTHEIVLYAGHSFYGSLGVLEEQSAYPTDTYQIFFMNSCWSYEYYTKQVFENKRSLNDPQGFELADVVNNTESGWTMHRAEALRILLTNLLAGCENNGMDGSRRYDWAGIIGAMNKFSLDEYNSYHPYYDWYDHHEIYGVSGVTSNCYDPNDPASCACTDRCHTVGEKSCDGDGITTCGDFDGDPCLEWSPVESCGPNQICRDGQCQIECLDDAWEDNDNFDAATPVTGSELGDLQICRDDDDWFRIEAALGDTIEIDLVFSHAEGDLDMQLFHQNDLEQSVAQATSSDDNERIRHPAEPAGFYYLRVHGYNSAKNSYRLTIGRTTQDDDPPPEECTDHLEPNDSVENASPVHEWNFNNLRICPDDQDWFAIELPAGSQLLVEVRFSHAAGDLDIELMEASRGTVASGTSSDDNESVEFSSEEQGVYYLKVYGHSDAENNYDLSISVQ